MKKKAQLKTLVEIIVILVVAVLLIFIIKALYDRFEGREYRDKCSTSVQYQAQIGLEGLLRNRDKPPLLLDIHCHTFKVDFYNDRVEIDGEPRAVMVDGSKTEKFDELTDDIVNQVLAYEMAWCWKQFQEGKMDIFNKEFADILDHAKVCFICDDISFKDVNKPSFKGFYQHLKDNGNIEFGDKSYYEYLTKENGRLCDDDYSNQGNCWEAYLAASIPWKRDVHAKMVQDIKFDTQQRYLIFFVREGLRVDGSGTYFTYIVPASKINNQCDKRLPTR